MTCSNRTAMNNRSAFGFWFFHAVLPLLGFAVATALFEFYDLDLLLSDPFYNQARAVWTYKGSWWADTLIHGGGRYLILAIALVALGILILSFVQDRWRRLRRQALFLVLAIGLGTGIVAVGKATINRHCPWDYQRYGGEVPYTRLFEPPPEGCRPGHGFPAGHASGAFSLMGGYFLFYRRSRSKALLCLCFGLALGSLFGYGQLVRGAHFVSHNFWSAIICWLISLGLYQLLLRKGEGQNAAEVHSPAFGHEFSSGPVE